MGEDTFGAVTDGNILTWGKFNVGTEPMNGFSNEFIMKIKMMISYRN